MKKQWLCWIGMMIPCVSYGASPIFIEGADSTFTMRPGVELQMVETYKTYGSIPREDIYFKLARFRVDGKAAISHLFYRIQMEFATPTAVPTASAKNQFSMRDVYMKYEPFSFFKIKYGQFKSFFADAFVLAPTKLQFILPSPATSAFQRDWELGGAVYGRLGSFLYDIGAFSGESKNMRNQTKDNLYTFRLRYGHGKVKKDGEPDLLHSNTPRWEIGVEALHRKKNSDTVVAYGMFGRLKWNGVSFFAELMRQNNLSSAPISTDLSTTGYQAQLGVFFWRNILEAAIRYGVSDPQGPANENKEWTLALNGYVKKHQFKLGLDIARAEMPSLVKTGYQATSLVQVFF